MTDKFLNKNEVCEWLGIGKSTLYKWHKLGMPYIKIDGVVRYNKEDVEQWLNNQKKN